jgi:coenzyme F420-0:L-glutamate ligase/coenzyme F420-1:gamma-L-glutamate ligase
VTLSVVAPEGAPEVTEGDDLALLLVGLLGPDGLADGDVVVVTSKVVAKSEGRVREGGRDEAVAAETVRVVARRGATAIVRTRHGLTMAAAGVDGSNVPAGHVVLLPLDPDASARRIRLRLHELTGLVVGVVVTDTAGRAWREGQTDIAVGAAGVVVAETYAGRTDAHGNPLLVTAPAVADEIAGAAELAQGKLAGRPFAVVRGRDDLVLPIDDDGDGAAALVRADGADMFGYGAREAVLHALGGAAADRVAFGTPASATELADALEALLGHPPEVGADGDGDVVLVTPRDHREAWAVGVAAYACGWEAAPGGPGVPVRVRPSPSLP